jgi:hypothetical protein
MIYIYLFIYIDIYIYMILYVHIFPVFGYLWLSSVPVFSDLRTSINRNNVALKVAGQVLSESRLPKSRATQWQPETETEAHEAHKSHLAPAGKTSMSVTRGSTTGFDKRI